MEKRLNLNQSITELLEEDDRLTLEGIASTMLSEAWGNDESYDKKGRRLLEAFQVGDVNAFCTALTGWSFEDILKKSGAIEDHDGACFSGDIRWSKNDPRIFRFLGVPYRVTLPDSVLWDKMMDLCAPDDLWNEDGIFTLLSDGEDDRAKRFAKNRQSLTCIRPFYRCGNIGLRPVFIPLEEDLETFSGERFAFLKDGRPAIMAPAKDFASLIPMSAEPLSPFEPVLLIKVGDVLVSNRAIAVGFSWEDLEQCGHYSFDNARKV